MYGAAHTFAVPRPAYLDLSQHHGSTACLVAKPLGRFGLKPLPPRSIPQAVAEGKPDQPTASLRGDERVVGCAERPGCPVTEGACLHGDVFARHHAVRVRISVTEFVQQCRYL